MLKIIILTMTTTTIIKEINRLPLSKRMLIIEKTLKSIRATSIKDSMTIAAIKLQDLYKQDKELTAFTNLDYAEFYEAR